jgi:hypothetical protein
MKILCGIGAAYALLIGYVSHGRSCILLLMFECFVFLMLFFIKKNIYEMQMVDTNFLLFNRWNYACCYP